MNCAIGCYFLPKFEPIFLWKLILKFVEGPLRDMGRGKLGVDSTGAMETTPNFSSPYF